MRHRAAATVLAMFGAALSGCSGLPATTLGHECGIPEGLGCMGTKEVYQRTVSGDLPGLNEPSGTGQPITPTAPTERGVESPIITDDGARVIRTSALYAPPEELRIWVNRWRDRDGDLHDSSFMYVLVGEGQWMVRD